MATSTRAAIVTGSSQGIGAVIAERLAADGLAVAVNYSSSPEPAKALVEKIGGAGGRAIAVGADVSDPAAVAELFSSSSSVVGLYQPTYAAYAATKAGIEAMSHILARELGRKGVAVNVIAPGLSRPNSSWTARATRTSGRSSSAPRCPARRAGGHRPRRLLPDLAGRRLDQRAGAAGQRRDHLMAAIDRQPRLSAESLDPGAMLMAAKGAQRLGYRLPATSVRVLADEARSFCRKA